MWKQYLHRERENLIKIRYRRRGILKTQELERLPKRGADCSGVKFTGQGNRRCTGHGVRNVLEGQMV